MEGNDVIPVNRSPAGYKMGPDEEYIEYTAIVEKLYPRVR